jgi:hypothetical protein
MPIFVIVVVVANPVEVHAQGVVPRCDAISPPSSIIAAVAAEVRLSADPVELS